LGAFFRLGEQHSAKQHRTAPHGKLVRVFVLAEWADSTEAVLVGVRFAVDADLYRRVDYRRNDRGGAWR